MASLPGSRTAGFIASPPAVSQPCGPPFASVVSTFPAPSGKPKPHETSALMSIPGKELHTPEDQKTEIIPFLFSGANEDRWSLQCLNFSNKPVEVLSLVISP